MTLFSLNVSESINTEKFVIAVIQTTVLVCTCTEESEPSLIEAHFLFCNLFNSNSVFFFVFLVLQLWLYSTLYATSHFLTLYDAALTRPWQFVALLYFFHGMTSFCFLCKCWKRTFLCVQHTRAVGRFARSVSSLIVLLFLFNKPCKTITYVCFSCFFTLKKII